MGITREELLREITFKTSRSGGKGGQHVNKVSSKVELNLHINSSALFSDAEKALLIEKLAKRINAAGILQVITEEDRSQLQNKEKSVEKLQALITQALHQPKARRATRPGKSAIERRLKMKQATAVRKINRKKDRWD